MQIGFSFPTMEITDPVAVRDVAQAAEGLGFAHLSVWEHVLGTDHAPGLSTLVPIHEPLVLLGYLAAVTTRLELVTEVLVLPQRQTGVVAKQAAEIQILSGGRLRLGVGVGWVEREAVALGTGFADRGARADEQLEVLRALVTQQVVTFHGRWHDIDAMGVRPLPDRVMPIWIGGDADAALRRAAVRGDGWMCVLDLDHVLAGGHLDRLRAYLAEAGRPVESFGIEVTVNLSGGLHRKASACRTPEDVRVEIGRWADLGVSYVSINAMGLGLTPDGHVTTLARHWTALEDLATTA
jgi:probable F420-dependent oxidoreductase